MNELSSLGMILLLALLAGHIVRVVRIPEVTGYLFAGIALGPSVLGWVSHENLQALEVLSEVALGLILFSIGSVFEWRLLRRFGPRVSRLTLAESALAACLVTVGMLLAGQPWQVALLLGAICIETAPASTLMVIRECHGRGPLSEALLGIIAINNILCIVAYSLAAAAIDLAINWGGLSTLAGSLYQALYPLVWQLLGSVALGFLVGLLLAAWGSQVDESGEMLILLAGSILLCVGVSRILDLSALVASLAVGATMVNLSRRSRRLFDALSGTDPPFYAIFFVIAGADLDLSSISELGVVGAVYLVCRLSGKFIGASVAARRLDMDPGVQRYLGFALLAQAGLAVGLVLTTERRFPEHGDAVKTVILAAVAFYEVLGPVAARYAIVSAGESRKKEQDSESIWALE
ncbi:MAG: hypothetical protein GC160_20495 [Acidobacteria bacterium]|nr:hypothetical protein [Acidobacteriota bacterium]